MTDRINKNILYRWRVRSAILFIPFVIWLARPTMRFLLGGMALCLIGLGIRAWAAGHLRKNKELTTSGPYQYSRNPLYLGNFILGLGISLASASWWVFLFFAIYFFLFYPVIIKKERERMKELFPGAYDEYGKRVPAFFPAPSRKNSNSHVRFSLPLYLKNKEYRAFLGTLVFWLILIMKMFLLKS